MHRANIGPTGCGKSYQAFIEAARVKKAVLFVNPKDDDVGGDFVRLDGNCDSIVLCRLLRKGYKVNYVPHRDRKIAVKELDIVVQKAFEAQDVFVIFDEAEVHGYEGLSFSPLVDVAERGRSAGVEGLFLVQDPAGVSKRILRQCQQFRIFAFNEYSRLYFDKLGYDVQKMQSMLLTAPKHSYIIMEGGEIKGIGRE